MSSYKKVTASSTPSTRLPPPQVTRLRLTEAPTAARAWVAAFGDDPLQRYLYLGARPTKFLRSSTRFFLSCLVFVLIRRHLVLTVDSGQGIVNAVPPALKAPSGIIDRIFDLLAKTITFVSARFKPRGYSQRHAKVSAKLKAATEKALGSRVNDMVFVEGLGMNPACQGRGYGGALLDAVTSMADASSQASYLYSCNVAANTKFYMAHGFLPVADVLAGDDDPEWDEPPVVVQLMVREVPEGISKQENMDENGS